MTSARDAWRAATRYEDLCRLGAAFLGGELDHFPGWGAADTDEETDALEDLLVACCAAGFLTVASQTAGPEVPGADGRPERRRAFVTGFVRGLDLGPLADAGLLVASELDEDLPLGLRGDDVFLALGPGAREAELALFAEDLSPAAQAELAAARWVCVADPEWGRAEHLWSALAAQVGTHYP